MNNKMNHEVKIVNQDGKLTYEKSFRTAEAACEDYTKNLAILKKFIGDEKPGTMYGIVRLNDGYPMAAEVVEHK